MRYSRLFTHFHWIHHTAPNFTQICQDVLCVSNSDSHRQLFSNAADRILKLIWIPWLNEVWMAKLSSLPFLCFFFLFSFRSLSYSWAKASHFHLQTTSHVARRWPGTRTVRSKRRRTGSSKDDTKVFKILLPSYRQGFLGMISVCPVPTDFIADFFSTL